MKDDKTALARQDNPSNELAQVGAMIQTAVDKGIDAEGIKALAETYQSFADRDASQQFNRAFSDFKDSCPPIRKTATRQLNKGGATSKFTPIEELERVCSPALRAAGFSWWWDGEPAEGGMFKTTFVLEHDAGHAKKSHFTLPISTRAGMGEQDKYASAYKWGKRITFMSGLGLTDSEEAAIPLSRISASQAADLEALIDETKADRARFLKYAGVAEVEEILTENYNHLCQDLRNMEKRR